MLRTARADPVPAHAKGVAGRPRPPIDTGHRRRRPTADNRGNPWTHHAPTPAAAHRTGKGRSRRQRTTLAREAHTGCDCRCFGLAGCRGMPVAAEARCGVGREVSLRDAPAPPEVSIGICSSARARPPGASEQCGGIKLKIRQQRRRLFKPRAPRRRIGRALPRPAEASRPPRFRPLLRRSPAPGSPPSSAPRSDARTDRAGSARPRRRR